MPAAGGDVRMEDDQAPPALRLVLGNVKGLTAVLQAVRPSAKQVCNVAVTADGLSLGWADESKAFQSSVYLRSELFSAYDAPREPVAFGLQLAQLVDALSTFACACESNSLALSYPGPEAELVLEMRDGAGGAGGPPLSMYARLSTLDEVAGGDLDAHWQEPSSWFLTRGVLLKEAVDDLEWPNGPVELSMRRDPRRLALRAVGGAGSLEIEIPGGEIMGWSAAAASVTFTYPYRSLRAALSNIPAPSRGDGGGGGGGTVSTKVTIDAAGVLKVTHMMSLLGRGGGVGGAGGTGYGGSLAPMPSSLPGAGSMATQTLLDGGRAGRVQYLVVPLADDLDAADEEAGGGGGMPM